MEPNGPVRVRLVPFVHSQSYRPIRVNLVPSYHLAGYPLELSQVPPGVPGPHFENHCSSLHIYYPLSPQLNRMRAIRGEIHRGRCIPGNLGNCDAIGWCNTIQSNGAVSNPCKRMKTLSGRDRVEIMIWILFYDLCGHFWQKSQYIYNIFYLYSIFWCNHFYRPFSRKCCLLHL